MALQMVRSFFGQGTPSRSRVHEPVIDNESFGNQGGNSSYDTRDVGKSANSNWFELARHHKEASELGRKPHSVCTSTPTGIVDCSQDTRAKATDQLVDVGKFIIAKFAVGKKF